MKQFKNTEDYIASFPADVQKLLKQMRQIIAKAEPVATEKISYGMPSFRLHGRYLVYFGGFKNHVSFFPASSVATNAFKKDLEPYDSSPGTVRFPLDKPLPKRLITQMVKFRAQENLAKTKS